MLLLLLLTFLYPHVTPVAYLFGLFQQCSAESTCCWFLPNSTAVQKIFSISCSTFHCMCLNLIPRAGYLVYSMLYHVADSICFYFSLVCSEYPFLKLCIFVHLIFFCSLDIIQIVLICVCFFVYLCCNLVEHMMLWVGAWELGVAWQHSNFFVSDLECFTALDTTK